MLFSLALNLSTFWKQDKIIIIIIIIWIFSVAEIKKIIARSTTKQGANQIIKSGYDK